MKVLFVIKSDFLIVPIGIRQLAAVLKNNGHECDIIDLKLEFNSIQKIKKYKPDIVGYSIETFNWKFYVGFNKKLKKYLNFFSVFGGAHCTTNPDVIHEEGIDAVCIGEGERAIVELADKMQNKKSITEIKNLWIKRNGKIYKNDVDDLIYDLDSLPLPDFDICFKYKQYKFDIYHISTSRGCPYNCPYCINHLLKKIYSGKGTYVRRRSVDHVIEELKIVKKYYTPKLIYFVDEVFTLNHTWLEEFVEKYKNHINIPFKTLTRFEKIDEKIIKLMHDAGYSVAGLGIETGNEKIRFELLKREITNELIIKTTSVLRKYKIKVLGFNMLGLPGETIDNAFETLELSAKCKITYPMVFIYQPFPNTDMARYSIEKCYYVKETDTFKNLSGKSLLNLKDRRKIERLYYLFYLCVKLPATIPLIKIMVKLPFRFLYWMIFLFFRAYINLFIMRIPTPISLIKYYSRSFVVQLQNTFVNLFK